MPDLKVTFTSIRVVNNGEWTGKGELYWDFLLDGEPIGGEGSRSINNARKTADGETIILNNATRTVTKNVGDSLTVEASVSEKDNLDKDETASFNNSFSNTGNWGIGNYQRILRDQKLDVTVSYQIERA